MKVIAEPPAPLKNLSPKFKIPIQGLLITLLATIISLLCYSPGWLGSKSANLVSYFTGWSPLTVENGFYQIWQTASLQIHNAHIPLWQATSHQPLLEASTVPILYPGALFYYFANDLIFNSVHLWLLGVGLILLIRRNSKPQIWFGPLVMVLLLASTLPPDWLATLSWLPLAFLLAVWRRTTVALLLLPIVFGLILLAGPIILSVTLCILVIFYWFTQNKALQKLALIFLCLIAGCGIAGPQLFPRLTYAGQPYDYMATALPENSASAVNGTVMSFNRLDGDQMRLDLHIPTGLQQITVNIKGRALPTVGVKPLEWSGQLLQNGERIKKGLAISVTGASGNAGDQTVTLNFEQSLTISDFVLLLRYNPLSFTIGLYAAFLAILSVGLAGLVAGWVRFYREDAEDSALRRVVKNSGTLLFAQLSGKVIDFGFAIIVLRILGADGNGQYAFATTTWLFFATLSDFGLDSLVTREMARVRNLPDAPEQINRLFVTKLFMRLGLSVALLPISLMWLGGFSLTGHLTEGSAWAVVLLMLGFWPSSVAASLTVVFRAYEKFEYTAASQLLTNILKVPLGISLLLIGWGVIGLAASSIILNIITVIVLQALLQKQNFKPIMNRRYFDFKLGVSLLGQAFPLMVNGLIISILFKSDGLILDAFRGNTEFGTYNSAYKFIDGLLIIPSTLTLVLFPLFSAYAADARQNLLKAYHEGLRILMLVGMPISAGMVFIAYDLIGTVGGTEFLPGGAIALQILIWFLPFSYVNGITQYVLIAINKQRNITLAVVAAAISNVGLNLLLIPFFGYIASAFLTILTELVLLVPFCRILRQELGVGAVPLFAVSWRPMLSAMVMMLVLFGLINVGINQFVFKIGVGGIVYIGGLVLTKAVTKEDLLLLKRVVRR